MGGGGGCFLDGEASFLSGGCPMGGTSVLVGGGVSKKIVGWGSGVPPHTPHYGKPWGWGEGGEVASVLVLKSMCAFSSKKCFFMRRIALLSPRIALFSLEVPLYFLELPFSCPERPYFYLLCASFSKNAFFPS